jgi:hypothetical protein
MSIHRILALTPVIAACAPAQAAQPMARCVGANGEVAFVFMPCYVEADPLRLRDHPTSRTPPSTGGDSGLASGTEAAEAPVHRLSGEQRMAENGNIRIRGQRCLTSAAGLIWAGVTDSVAARPTTIARRERQTLHARNNLASATWELRLREQIAAETVAIATEAANERRVQANLEQQCRKTAAEERRRLNEDGCSYRTIDGGAL